MMAVCVLCLLAAAPLAAQEPVFPWSSRAVLPSAAWDPVAELFPAHVNSDPGFVLFPQGLPATCDEVVPDSAPSWRTVWGVVGIRVIPVGPKVAPNGLEYHPNFSMDLDFNLWLWRSQGLYLFADLRLWGQRGEDGVTNGRDGFFATSKREFDFTGGVAWNYAGPWEARAFGYTGNNLNRGTNQATPSGFTDGFGMENRYYLSPEYEKLGQTGFDVTRATFLSIGYLPSKVLVGNNGRTFEPGLMLRAYLTLDLWDWPAYAFSDATYIGERPFQNGLLIFDLGVAVQPFRFCRQCEIRLGAESTADFQAKDVWSLWYGSVRFIF
jgi:hypothetical protein